MVFYHVLSEVIPYQGKPLDLSNTLINSHYLGKLLCQVLVLQSIIQYSCIESNKDTCIIERILSSLLTLVVSPWLTFLCPSLICTSIDNERIFFLFDYKVEIRDVEASH